MRRSEELVIARSITTPLARSIQQHRLRHFAQPNQIITAMLTIRYRPADTDCGGSRWEQMDDDSMIEHRRITLSHCWKANHMDLYMAKSMWPQF